MKRNAVLAVATTLACAAGTVAVAAPAHAAAWKDVPSAALNYDGSLDRVDFGAKNAGWAVGAAGNFFGPQAKIARWNGSSWVADSSPASFTPTDVAVAGPDKAWIIGYSLFGTTSLHWNGTKWNQVAYPLVGFPTAVSAAPDGTAYSIAGLDAAAGGPSAILRWTGSGWLDPQVPLPPSSSITAVDVRAKDDVWLAGTTASAGTSVTGLVMHWNGTSWKQINVPGNMGVPAYQGTLHRIVVNSPTNVYVLRVRQNAQISNAILRYNGTSWQTINTPLNAAGIGLTSDGSDGVVMLPITTGDKTQYMHYNGTSWTTVNGPARSGGVQATDADHRPGTTAIVSAGTASAPDKKSPFIEYFS
ncbi:hypothetical protein E1200_12485 [Actinomadura sp. GC306]|uniref:hypothetical protein n=1 Tax=Actinomadura sp. GC306 TaxID=2530367 RepID=UPI00104E8356|nr:hypothetical protein [Actinomadura sp. GC306]TDC68195.1 hypothetical protein E1200_12485 [Actinomadura sp. GC306]